SLAPPDVLAAATEQDRLRVGIVEVDPGRRARHRDPSIDLQLGVGIGTNASIALASLWSGRPAPGPALLEPTIDDHLDSRVVSEGVAQRPTRVLTVSRDHDQYRALTVLHADSP